MRSMDKSPLVSLRAGAVAGCVGGACIWVYEALVWVGVQHLMPLIGIPRNAVGLVFGRAIQNGLGYVSYPLGTAIHFGFAMLWGVVFAFIWPRLRRRGIEATFAALVYAVLLWAIMHAAIALATNDHPNYLDPNIVIGGVMSHLFYTVPMALLVKAGVRN